jgi:hypothetical protein
MHPSLSHQLATINQHRLLDEAAAERLARIATAGRRSPGRTSSLLTTIRRGLTRRSITVPEPRTAEHGRA